jgi:LmbE family N-acetylglucosaminyl deacetylase
VELDGPVVAVHAHPDDESITTGGLLAKASAMGLRTVVVTCTGGDVGPNRTGVNQLAHARAEELQAALTILDVSQGIQLGYRDSGLAGWPDNNHPASFHAAPLGEAAQKVSAILREVQPRIVVTYGPDGGYGHPDHIKAHQVTLEAFRRADLPGSRLYAVAFPRRWLRRFTELSCKAGVEAREPALLGIDDLDAPPGFGAPDSAPVEELDVGAYVEAKRAAVAAHATQMDGHVLTRLPADVLKEIWSREFYVPLRS